jgi:hypothetical protein
MMLCRNVLRYALPDSWAYPGCRRCRCADGGTARAKRPRPQRSAGIPARDFSGMAGWKTRPPLLGFLAGHKRLADGLGIAEDPSLDGFVFAGGGHDLAGHSVSDCANFRFGEAVKCPTLCKLGRLRFWQLVVCEISNPNACWHRSTFTDEDRLLLGEIG